MIGSKIRRAAAALFTLGLGSIGSASAAPYVADIIVTYEGEQVGSGSFTFDPDEATVIPGIFGDPYTGPLEEGRTVYGLVRDFSLSFTLDGHTYDFGTPWRGFMGPEIDGSTLGQIVDRDQTYGQVGIAQWTWGEPREGFYFQMFRSSGIGGASLLPAVIPGADPYYSLGIDFSATPLNAVPLPGAALFMLTGLAGIVTASSRKRA